MSQHEGVRDMQRKKADPFDRNPRPALEAKGFLCPELMLIAIEEPESNFALGSLIEVLG